MPPASEFSTAFLDNFPLRRFANSKVISETHQRPGVQQRSAAFQRGHVGIYVLEYNVTPVPQKNCMLKNSVMRLALPTLETQTCANPSSSQTIAPWNLQDARLKLKSELEASSALRKFGSCWISGTLDQYESES